jgi:DNA-entry nuclease
MQKKIKESTKARSFRAFLCALGILFTVACNSSVFADVEIPAYSGDPYVVLEDNQPDFTEDELTVSDYESYSELDYLGRCGTATACVGLEIMPTEKRGSIGQVKPSGWQTVKYDFVDGNYLYNRCHLIGYQLSGENANEKNLITGTRYMNVTGMLPFENLVADYVKETENHVLYRVTPVFIGENLVADGVEMEAESIEDDGEGVLFHVFVYNVQPGVTINYADGSSWRTEEDSSQDSASEEMTDSYIVNTNTGKFHLLDCYSVSQMKESNKQYFEGSRDELIAEGYSPCKNCNP